MQPYEIYALKTPVTVEQSPSKLQAWEWGSATRIITSAETLHCRVVLRRHPMCLYHELRHCIEGDWHQSTEHNIEDC